tara:strand:- start:232 stop:393 length:162 start_codon:yes stop_codon:yes gene_type:complete
LRHYFLNQRLLPRQAKTSFYHKSKFQVAIGENIKFIKNIGAKEKYMHNEGLFT